MVELNIEELINERKLEKDEPITYMLRMLNSMSSQLVSLNKRMELLEGSGGKIDASPEGAVQAKGSDTHSLESLISQIIDGVSRRLDKHENNISKGITEVLKSGIDISVEQG